MEGGTTPTESSGFLYFVRELDDLQPTGHGSQAT
jgi:hypothetical protein